MFPVVFSCGWKGDEKRVSSILVGSELKEVTRGLSPLLSPDRPIPK